jgi:pimeloyl-ACP methyl ester carboxylesterase
MSNLDILQRIAIQSIDEIEQQLAENPKELQLNKLVGKKEADQLAESARAPKARGPREAVVLLPGIMGSLLFSIRGVTTMLWINPLLFLNGQGGFLKAGSGGSGVGSPEVDCVAFSLEKLTYLKLALELRRTCAVYEFPYDWRLPIEHNGDLLRESIERWSAGNPAQQFTLVAHSMGGLVSRAYLGRHPKEAEKRIKRLITLGTPHLGATSAIDNLFNGNSMMATVDKLNKQNGMREVVLSMPSVYQLLPAPKDTLPGDIEYPANWDLYDASAWNVEGLRQENLDLAKSFHQFLVKQDPQVDLVQIAGCNIATTTLASLVDQAGKRKLDLVSFEEGIQSGDGTVPGWSGFYAKARMFYIQEVHRNLPGNMKVIQAVQELIQSGTCGLNKRIPKRKTGIFGRAPIVSPTAQAAVLEDKIRSGTINENDLNTLYFAD